MRVHEGFNIRGTIYEHCDTSTHDDYVASKRVAYIFAPKGFPPPKKLF